MTDNGGGFGEGSDCQGSFLFACKDGKRSL